MANHHPSPALTFEVLRDGQLIHRVELAEPSITIGSGATALLRIDDPNLAELHAVLHVEENGTLSLLDLGSEQGVHVGGRPVSSAELRSGDTFHAGPIEIRVHLRRRDARGFDEEENTAITGALPPDEITEETPAPAPMASPPVRGPRDHVHDFGASDDDEVDDIEDVMAFILRSGASQSSLGEDANRPQVLEVNQLWGNNLLDTQHFHKRTTGHDVTIGTRMGWRWHFLGVDMGWVPAPLHRILPFTPPLWSEVTSDWRNHFFAPDDRLSGGEEHVLFKHDLAEEKYTAQVMTSWDGFVDIGDQRFTFEELVAAGKARRSGDLYEIPMEPGVRLMVDVDGVIFFSHMVNPGARILVNPTENLDYPFLAIFSVVTFLGLMFGVVMYFSPEPPENQVVEIPDRFVQLMIDKPDPEPKEQKKPDGNQDAGEGAKAKKEEGKVGKKDAKIEKAKGNKVEIQKQEVDRQIAENAGVLGALQNAGDLDGIFGNSGLDSNLTGGIGGLIGAKGSQVGSGGLGARGSGLGGGGTAEGLGGLGTKGVGSGASGYGSGGGNFGSKGEGGIGTVGGDPIILGALDRSLIDEVVKRHMNQIRYCYQRELTKDPSLNGKVVIKFVIAKDGTVSSANPSSTTLNNNAVESCMVGRFMRMQFPEPKGGGIVIVSYPFLFSPG